uniref:Ubiquitin carboxyl-terminal hydrolase 24 n=1 Tax=Sinocyclocheilus anshuiensis TaxID=1608454 RepID=A0A671LMJ9_9TELE
MMETEEEQHTTTLLCMGFPDPVAIRKALRLAKNDINEAVALLTNESPGLGYGYEPMESGPSPGSGPSGDGESSGRTGTGGFDPPPAYHDVVESERTNDENGNCSGNSMEFPTTNLYELESRVFTDHWSIPYKREESLGKCLIASTCLARLGLADADENCKRFTDRCMPEAFKKLLTSSAVHKWGTEIHEGIYNMLMLLVDLVAERVKQDPIPIGLMGILTMAFNPDNEYHFKNRMKACQRNWAEVFGEDSMFAVSPSSSYQKEPHGWLVDLVNRFGEMGGFTAIQCKLNQEEIEIGCVSALVQPLGVCAEYLNSSLVQPMLDPVIHKMITYVQNLEEKDLKDKRLVSIPELLSAIKLLCMRFQRELVNVVDDLRLDILLRMLKTPHFSAKMNSLKEVTKLIEESTVSKTVKNAIDTDRLLDWLVENSVLSIALEGNIDQAQYCDRIKGIIELLGSKLSLDELSKIWKIQAGQSSTVIENIHTIIAAAAVKFNFDQLSHLFVLIQKSWEVESDRVRQKLLSLIGRIGREARSEATTGKVLEVLWELAHLPTLPTTLVQQALEEHLTILSDAYAVKETIKKNYIVKCIEDIKKMQIQEDSKSPSETQVSFLTGTWGKKKPSSVAKSSQQTNPQTVWVVPALRQLHEITRSFIKQTYQKQDKSIIQDLKKNFEIVKLITGSLVSCHRLAVSVAGSNGLSGSTLVDGRYSYQEYLEGHLKFLAFFLQEASLYLVWNRAKEIWECLVSSMDVCELDREMCFEWFTKGQHDLESDVQQQLFKEKILKLEPYEITMNGFNLFKTFFENVNLSDHRLKRQGTQLCVERLDLAGMDFIWRIAMESPDEDIANEAIHLIITYSYINLNPKMKKDSVSLHKKFIADCYKRLEAASSALGGPTLTHAVTRATKMLTATAMPTVATSVQSPSRSSKLVIIERLLLLAERYVITIEDLYSVPRTILPHGASFHGHPVTLHITYESTKDTFTLEAHSNETIGSIRWKIAEQLSCPVDNVQIFANDSMLTMNRDQKLLNQLGFSDEQSLTVKSSGTGTPSGSSADSSASASSSSSGVFNSAYAMEQEKSLPGVVMALVCNVFEMLYQLANLEEPRITLRVRKLLLLIPTDPEVQDALDNFVPKESSVWSHQKTLFTLGSGSQASKSPSLSSKQQHQQSAASILESLFRSSAPGMSTFRVLYNLEVLSSKLMPTSDDEMAKTSVKSFCENFLKAGGLSLVVNVMQRDSIPSEVDYETRQGVYSICLQLARFLLVGQAMPSMFDEELSKEGLDTLSSRPFRNTGRQSGRQLSVCGTPEKSSYRQVSMSDRSSIRVEEIMPAARVAIQVCRPTGPCCNCSSGSEGEVTTLQAGICVKQLFVSIKDTIIAREALSLLVTCLQLRCQQLSSFYTLPSVNDFIIDILLGSPSGEVRRVACDQLYTLSQSDTSAYPDLQKPNLFLLKVVLTAQLPLWSPTSIMRGVNQRLLSQCTEYFDLRCQLLDDLTTSEMEQLQIGPAAMLEDEISWLDNFEPTWTNELETSEADNILLAGHLRLIKTLLSLCGINVYFLFQLMKIKYFIVVITWLVLMQIFKMWNKELYVREQQDAYEFFTSLVDQLDEHLKKISREQIFKNTFQGIFSDQKICKDCPHRYEREETFMALNLGVTSCQSLEISLDQFVRGEVLDGSNAYYCEKCKEKRTTVKRTCIKSLPSVLVIHLMRFGFDWESGRSIKYDEQIRFPWVLNMEPYTVSGMARQDSSADHGENGRGGEAGSGGSPRKKVTISENYELVGVVVHSGQAHAGHYYSFIKDRRGSSRGRWYKFNDNVVEEFDMNDETLEYECFGGEYRPKVYDQSNPYPDVRRRYWNAYMLFYQRISDQNSPVLPKKSRVSIMRQEAEDLSLSAPSSPEISPQSSPRPPRANNDRLTLLTRLVKKGEKKGLFVEKMPARIYQMVRDENLKFMKNRDVYNSDYFNFTLSLASVNATKLKHPSYQAMAKTSLQLAVQFLFHTYLRTKKKLRVDTEEWIATVEVLLSKSSEACQWMVQYLVAPEGRELIKICLLECSVREVRVVVATILEKTLESALYFQDAGLDCLLDMLLSLLDKDVLDNCKNCSQYFSLFSNFAQRGCGPCQLLLKHSAYRRMLVFLLGPNRQNNQHRRWNSAQAREFLHLHNTLALIVLHTDLTCQRMEAQGVFKHASSGLVAPSSPLLPLHPDINTLLFKAEGQVYLMEVMFAMRELSGPLSFLIEMITYCSFCNEPFSLGVLHILKSPLETAPPHELKNVFQMLLEILMIEDALQSQRLKYAFESEKGLLALMHQSNNVDSSRCYQCVKFLVTLAQKCSPAKDYFKELSGHWSWAVQWLQKKMSEHYWTPQSNVSNETSTAKTFQRTISAQDTLAYATALLNEKEQSSSSNGSDGSPANENSDRSLRQGSESPMMLGDSRSDLEDVDP